MKKLYSVLALIPVLACFLCLFFFRQVPKGELWKGFSVLYVPQEVPEDKVFEALNQFDVREITCLSNQYLPIDLKADSCEISLLSLNQDAMEYLQRRSNFFFDKNKNLKLYYVPVYYKAKLAQAASYLNKSISGYCGVDSKAKYPFLIPLFALVYAVLLFFFSRKKELYGVLAILPVLFTVSFPFLSSEISVLILLTVLFLLSNVFGRRDFMKVLTKKYIFMLLLLLAFVSVIGSGFRISVTFVLLFLAEYSVLFIFRQFQIVRYKKNHFNPVMIRSSFSIPQYSGKEWLVFGSLLFFTVFSFCFSIMNSGLSGSKKSLSSGKVLLPSVSASQKSAELPELNDYYQWDFLVRSYPYRSLNKTTDMDSVSISRFEKTSGKIEKSVDSLEYSENYREGVYNRIELLPFNAFEKIMKKQGQDFSAGYSSNGSHRLSLFCIIISFIQFTIILAYFAWIMISDKNVKRRGRK